GGAAAGPARRRPAAGRRQRRACLGRGRQDLISFLEMHSLPGAYALVIAAHGIQDLSQLLTLDDAALDRVLVKCELDAVDEILLKDALQRVRPNPDGD
ncbi:unnamed protein product, partial [Prorocentrum cordatum]